MIDDQITADSKGNVLIVMTVGDVKIEALLDDRLNILLASRIADWAVFHKRHSVSMCRCKLKIMRF